MRWWWFNIFRVFLLPRVSVYPFASLLGLMTGGRWRLNNLATFLNYQTRSPWRPLSIPLTRQKSFSLIFVYNGLIISLIEIDSAFLFHPASRRRPWTFSQISHRHTLNNFSLFHCFLQKFLISTAKLHYSVRPSCFMSFVIKPQHERINIRFIIEL